MKQPNTQKSKKAAKAAAGPVFLNVAISIQTRNGLNRLRVAMNARNQGDVLEKLISAELKKRRAKA